MVIFRNQGLLIHGFIEHPVYNIRCDIFLVTGTGTNGESDRTAPLTKNRTYAVTRDNSSGRIKRETVCQNCRTRAPANLQRRILHCVNPSEILSGQKRRPEANARCILYILI